MKRSPEPASQSPEPASQALEPASRSAEPVSRPAEPASRPVEPASRSTDLVLRRAGAVTVADPGATRPGRGAADPGWRVVRHKAGARRLVVVLVAVCAAGLVAAGAVAVRGRDADRTSGAAASPAPPSASPTEAAMPSATLVEPPPAGSLPPPDRVRMRSIEVDTPLEALDIDASTGALRVPSDFGHAGWFAKGPAPGDLGPAVIAGHVDSRRGPAVFFRLRELRVGDTIEVSRGGTWVSFRVIATESYPKTQFPTEKVYRPTPVPELRLITCGGTFDPARRSYQDNIVVYAIAA